MTIFLKRHKFSIIFCCIILAIVISGFNVGYNHQLRLHSVATGYADTGSWPGSFEIGRRATDKEIQALNISIMPDGRGLPVGAGTVATGEGVYKTKCAFCHGKNGTEGPSAPLVGSMGDTTKAKTIGNYWPYATTLFDYIRRAMPYNMPGSLNNNEVYSLTAYLLYKNKITDQAMVINSVSLPKIKMPAQKLFIDDGRCGGKEIR